MHRDVSPDIFDVSDEDGLGEILDHPTQAISEQWKQKRAAPKKNLKQTTLFGTQPAETLNSQPQSDRRHNWPLVNKQEKPTHHRLNGDEINTWVYPTNLGTIREYQFNIVARGLFQNLLVALPTGLGKTFIAATIMLNWFRWTKDSMIIFAAPTKPLVSQQVEACFHIAGIPRSATTMLTGGIQPDVRAEEWASKRVFFVTPQTLINDLKRGSCDPKKVVLLVVDEAHRATGGYAYVEVVKFLRRFNPSFRVLALTATPGSSVESVQAVIDGLGISKVEIRTEESLDIRQYVHPRKIETMEFEPSDEMTWIFEELSKALQPLVDLMRSKNAYWSKDPMTLTAYGCTQARQKWMVSDAGRRASMGEKGQVMWVFSTLASIAHSIELLKFHGITPFYHKIKAFKDEEKGSKYAKQVREHQSFQDILAKLRIWVLGADFIGHPKLDYLQATVLEHFVSASEGRHADPEVSPSKTRVMIFAHFRDSAEEIVRVLNRNSPLVKAHVFVGQASAAGSEGMNQKKQLEIIEQFRQGVYNTLVATSIGEEGLDIGEIDLIICYDASASPIRMLQRMGRTGRKRAGEVVVLLMKGKEVNNFAAAKDNYEKMQLMIADGQRFTFHTDILARIIPKEIQPIVDKRIVEIPIENSQPSLPEPTRRSRTKKRVAKKFNMPDGVETGFVTARRIGMDEEEEEEEATALPVKKTKPIKNVVKSAPKYRSPSPILEPPLSSVLLSSSEQDQLERNYLEIAGDETQTVEMPRLDAFPALQRVARPIKHIQHGAATKRVQQMLAKMNRTSMTTVLQLESNLDQADAEVSSHECSTHKRKQQSDDDEESVGKRSHQSTPIRSRQGQRLDSHRDSPEQLFWTSPAKTPEHVDASQGIPDLDTVLGLAQNRSFTSNHAGKATNELLNGHDTATARPRKRRPIIDSDSDSNE